MPLQPAVSVGFLLRDVPECSIARAHVEGLEVRVFINRMVFANGWSDKASLPKVERMIHDSMPEDVKTVGQAWEWIGMNWHAYS